MSIYFAKDESKLAAAVMRMTDAEAALKSARAEVAAIREQIGADAPLLDPEGADTGSEPGAVTMTDAEGKPLVTREYIPIGGTASTFATGVPRVHDALTEAISTKLGMW
jgi:hypothetical protein